MSEDTKSSTTDSTRPLGNKSSTAVRSTRTPTTMFSGDNIPTPSTSTSTRTRTRSGGDRPLHRGQTLPTPPTAHSSTPETSSPRRQQTIDFPLSISVSHSSDSQTFRSLPPIPTLPFQTQNQRESIASTEPSSYYSADDSFNASLNDENIPPMPIPHPLSFPTRLATAQTPSTSASEQTVVPTQDSGLAYRTSTRTTASTSTRTTGRSCSTVASVIEPSRQSTSDSDAYPRGNGFGSQKNRVPEEGGVEDLAVLVAGLEELVEEPELEDEEPKWEKMKMPEPQYFGTRLPTTKEEDEDDFDYQADEGYRTMRMPEPSTHSREQSSSTIRADTSSRQPSSFSTGTAVRKAPLVIPPTPKSPPPVPSLIEIQASSSGGVARTGQGRSSRSKPQLDEDRTHVVFHPLRAGPSTGGSTAATAPLNVRRSKRPSSTTAAGGEGISSGAEPEASYGTATITGVASSRIERPEKPESAVAGGGAAPTRTSIESTNISGTGSGRAKTDSSSHHRPSIDANTYARGRPTTTASASGVSRPLETSGGGSGNRRPPPQEKAKPFASAALDATTLAGRPRLPRGVSQMDTQYVNMLLALDDIPTIHNLAAAFFNWVYLAGFVLFPGTFTSLKNLGAEQGNTVAAQLIDSVTNLPLFIVAWVCVGIGGVGMLWLVWRWNKNYIWVLNKIWTPGLLNSLAGLVSTVASIYGAQHGQFSSTSKVTFILTGVSSVVFAVLTAFYMFGLVRRAKNRHDAEVGVQRAGKHGEGMVDLSARRGGGSP